MISVRNISHQIPKTEPQINSIKYSRLNIVDDQVIEPYQLVGFKRTLFLIMYSAIVISAISGLAYSIYVSPLFAISALAVGYFFDNLIFALGHFEFHTSFIEIPEKKMSTLCHNSFIHHYRNIFVYHEKWLETRMCYFGADAKEDLTLKSAARLIVPFLMVAAVAFFISPLLAIAWYSAQAVPALLQSVIHEWYHNPQSNRKSFYSFPVYWLLKILEKISIASTKVHMAHHQQGLNNLDEVEQWLDLYIPFGEVLPTIAWKKILTVYEPGQYRMNDIVWKYGFGILCRGFRLSCAAMIFGLYFWIR